MADVFTGEVNVVASLAGKEDSKLIYINNYCKCPSTLTMTSDVSSIAIGTQAKLFVTLENGGVPVSGWIYFSVNNGLGNFTYGSMQTGIFTVIDEKAEAFNTISGVTQCTANSVINSVTGVYTYYEDDVTKIITHTSNNLLSSFLNRTIDLDIFLPTGTPLVITYVRSGAVENYFNGFTAGEAQIVASVPVNTEEGLSQSLTITITDPSVTPPVVDPGDPGGGETSYSLASFGPTDKDIGGIPAGGGANIGPWYATVYPVPSGSGITYTLTNTVSVSNCTGWVEIHGNSIRICLVVQVITVTLTSTLTVRTNGVVTHQQQQSWPFSVNIHQ